jgi:ferrous iron transport protein A
MVKRVLAMLGPKRRRAPALRGRLDALRLGAEGVVDALEVPAGAAQRLQELGFLPGARVTAAWSAPGGDPRVYRVDGAEIALRRETAERIVLRKAKGARDAG